jgi:nucleoid-associated protein YgaU
VRPGDSLWAIAARHLPPGAPDAAVDRAWRLLAAANRPSLGNRPDLIFPGAVLRVPDLSPALRKEVS